MSDYKEQSTHDINIRQYIADLKSPWSTMAPDMETALEVINQHARTEDLDLLSVENDSLNTRIKFPDWQSEIEKIYINQYGQEDGKLIFKKVIMRLYQLSKGTAVQLH